MATQEQDTVENRQWQWLLTVSLLSNHFITPRVCLFHQTYILGNSRNAFGTWTKRHANALPLEIFIIQEICIIERLYLIHIERCSSRIIINNNSELCMNKIIWRHFEIIISNKRLNIQSFYNTPSRLSFPSTYILGNSRMHSAHEPKRHANTLEIHTYAQCGIYLKVWGLIGELL